MTKDNEICNDVIFTKILNSQLTYIIILVLVVIYVFADDRVLNFPKYLFPIRCLIAFILIVLLVIWRYKKHIIYYKRKFKDKVYIIALLSGIITFTLLFQALLNIPVLYLIKYESKNNAIEYSNCQITNVINRKFDKIQFKYLGEKYSRSYKLNNYDRNDLMKNYMLEIGARKSLWDTYYIESMHLKRNK